MIRQSTIELLKEMRFSALASELERQLADEETYREMSFEDRLAMLVDAEWNRRQSNKYTRCLHMIISRAINSMSGTTWVAIKTILLNAILDI